MSPWDDDFGAPRPGPRVVESTSCHHFSQFALDDERPLSKAPLIPRDTADNGAYRRHENERKATALLQGLLS